MTDLELLYEELNRVITSHGIIWTDYLAEEIRKLIDKSFINKLTDEEQKVYDKAFDLYFTYDCDFDAFVNWETWVKFCETFTPDFFGMD